MTNHPSRSPLVRALTEATSEVLSAAMHERTDNVARLETLELVLNAAINATADQAVNAREQLDRQRERVRRMIPFAGIHDLHASGRLSWEDYTAALEAAKASAPLSDEE